MISTIKIGGAALDPRPRKARLAQAGRGGDPSLVLEDFDALPPFLMCLPTPSNLWMYLSSSGALTAGRINPDHCLFPYSTDDRLHDAASTTGPLTLVRAVEGSTAYLWEPFSQAADRLWRTTRTLEKALSLDWVAFREVNYDLGLEFSYTWRTSETHGFVRTASLRNLGPEARRLEVLDGLRNLMPSGLGRRFQAEFSTLADAYRCAESLPGGLCLYRLSSIPIDRAEPAEALAATGAYLLGAEARALLLSDQQVPAFRAGAEVVAEVSSRGRRGAFLARLDADLAPGEARSWTMVAEVDLGAEAVVDLAASLLRPGTLLSEVEAGIAASREELRRLVAEVDGIEVSGDGLRSARHYANALYNAMRGGLPMDGYRIDTESFAAAVRSANRQVFARRAAFFEALPEVLDREDLVRAAEAEGDPDLERLAREFLPFTFSRRHGDPSRPWNAFSVEPKDGQGRRILGYEGNWRDIFQNWEALGLSYPGFYEAMIFKFLDASTADGYNPYRITHQGLDWEVIDEDDSWSFIGYWGDHQAAYLLRLLEALERFEPGRLASFLDRPLFTYAQVPYRIAPYEAILAHPRSTVSFDAEGHRWILERAATLGADGKLLRDGAGQPCRAGLGEKLLVTILAKLSNFVPGAGLWLNTQRPEWNDANNALVGYGASVVTLSYLLRLLRHAEGLFAAAPAGGLDLPVEVARWARAVAAALEGPARDAVGDPRARRRAMDALGQAGSAYREGLYASGFSGARAAYGRDEARGLCAAAARALEESLAASRRSDGLYHAYTVLRFEDDRVEVEALAPMLEGQVAILSSGLLGPAEALLLLRALRASDLYRADQASYLLYPDRSFPSFLDLNRFEPGAAAALVEALVASGSRLVVRDREGHYHFGPSAQNGRLLGEALTAEAAVLPSLGPLVEAQGRVLLDLYEATFHHRRFTGRSGSFCKYEGLGSIYWHMVSKLLLAVGEAIQACPVAEAEAEARAGLESAYREIREGLGVHKDPGTYGAFPTDPYSHTPSFQGAQQPGMTGQVKEDLISRLFERGLAVREGRLHFGPGLMEEADRLGSGETLDLPLPGQAAFEVEAGAYAYTFCGLPVVVHPDAGPGLIRLTRHGGGREEVEGLSLDRERSASLFRREGRYARLDIFLPPH